MSLSTQTEPQLPQRTLQQHDKAKETTAYLNPHAGTYSVGDCMKDQCIGGLTRLLQVTPSGFHWMSLMITVILRFVYFVVVHLSKLELERVMCKG